MEAARENLEYPHLPPGREPGPQSRTRKRGKLTRKLFGGVGREAEHFQVAAQPRELRRGDEVQATLRIDRLDEVGERIEVGLVCTEFWDDRVRDSEGNTRRETQEHEWHREWVEAQRTAPIQTFTFTIPEGGPPSYEGATVSVAWRVSAREPETLRRDPRSDCAVWVLP